MQQNATPNVVTIVSGNFSNGKGNFWGLDLLGNGLFIHKKLMASKGWTKDADVKFPFHVVVTEKEITIWDENNQPILDEAGNPKKEMRKQASSIFLTEEDLIAAFVSVSTLPKKIQVAVEREYEVIGLSEEKVSEMKNLA